MTTTNELPIVKRAAVAKVWPPQVADSTAEHLTPRQIDMLYASAEWAYQAAALIKELEGLCAKSLRWFEDNGYAGSLQIELRAALERARS